jgi:hypothetical protein
MNNRPWLWLCLVSLGGVGLAAVGALSAARGQAPYRPHIQIPSIDADSAGLEEKLSPYQIRRDFELSDQQKQDLLELLRRPPLRGLPAEAVRELVDSFKNGKSRLNLNDPKLRKLIEAVAARQRAGGEMPALSAAQRDALKELIPPGGALDQWLRSKGADPSNPSQPDSPANPPGVAPPDLPAPSQVPPSNPAPTDSSPTTSSAALDSGRVTQWILRMAERFKDNPGPLRNSPTVQQAITNLGRALTDAVGSQPRETSSGGKRGLTVGSKLTDLLPSRQRLAAAKPSWMPAWPSLPAFKVPRFNISLKGDPTPNLNGFRRPSFPGGGRPDGPGWLEVAVFALGGVVLFVLVLGWRSKAGPSGGRENLGPWPVRPERVASRLELIWAFEYLALRDLGPAARSRNHRALAVGLGGPDEPRRQAAAELSALYEQARYTPGDAPLGAEAVASARRALCLLAGVSAA